MATTTPRALDALPSELLAALLALHQRQVRLRRPREQGGFPAQELRALAERHGLPFFAVRDAALALAGGATPPPARVAPSPEALPLPVVSIPVAPTPAPPAPAPEPAPSRLPTHARVCANPACGKTFVPHWRGSKQPCCSRACSMQMRFSRACANPTCGKTFVRPRTNPTGRFCSVQCAGIARRKHPTVTCAREGCDEQFVARLINNGQPQRYCSNACSHAARLRPPPSPRVCPFCQTTFVPVKTKPKQIYCGRTCAGRARHTTTSASPKPARDERDLLPIAWTDGQHEVFLAPALRDALIAQVRALVDETIATCLGERVADGTLADAALRARVRHMLDRLIDAA